MYIATLRKKQGEIRALKETVPSSNFIPNIIINEGSFEELESIQKSYKGTVWIDCRNLDQLDIEDIIDLKKDNNIFNNFFIVYPVDYLFSYDVSEPTHCRIDAKKIDQIFISGLENQLDLVPQNIVIDFGFLPQVSQSEIDNVSKLVPLLNNRNIVISSGNIPLSVPKKANENFKLSRAEKELYFLFKNEFPTTSFIYGDYTTISPLDYESTNQVIPIVQIKYTLDNYYVFYRNGQRISPYDFVKVCSDIVQSHGSLFSPAFSWGDKFISDVHVSGKNKGNPSTWVSIGCSHHIKKCILDNI